MLWSGLVPHWPEPVEILFQFLQVADALLREAIRFGRISSSHRLLPEHEVAGLFRHPRRQIQFARQNFSRIRIWFCPEQGDALLLNFFQSSVNLVRRNLGKPF